jgi:hypothetical protein
MTPPIRHSDDDDGNRGGWEEYKKLILSQIHEMREAHQDLNTELRESIQSIRDEVQTFRSEMADDMKNIAVDIGKLNVKAGLWGALAGAVLTASMMLMQQFANGR